MLVLVDTSVWSLLFRRQVADLTPGQRLLNRELGQLVRERRARLIGPVRQELLSGIRKETQYLGLRDHLRSFPDEPLDTSDYELAARLNNRCRAAGVAGSHVDFLICAVAIHRQWVIFTTDGDFHRYARLLPIDLYWPRQ